MRPTARDLALVLVSAFVGWYLTELWYLRNVDFRKLAGRP